jgi:chromosomal replication initiator protein
VAKGPGRTSYNPLFIYGGTGLGKTHLMEAIGHYVLDHSPSSSVCFITSETFLNEYVNAIQNDALPAFRERYRKVDVLLLDDVQFIAGKEKVQEEFFNTFNSLILYHKQIVITSDVSPKNLNRFEERLIGRFQQGMVVEIESPSYETRLAILKFKAQSTQKIIPEEILKFIAENIRSHVRAIEGALSRIVTFMSMQGDVPLTIEIAKHLLRDSIEEEKSIKDLSISDIMKTVATFYGVTIDDILSAQRTQTLVTPRQLAMFLSRKLTTRSLQEIAEEFKKTHATVLHGAQTIQKRLDVEPELKKINGGHIVADGTQGVGHTLTTTCRLTYNKLFIKRQVVYMVSSRLVMLTFVHKIADRMSTGTESPNPLYNRSPKDLSTI